MSVTFKPNRNLQRDLERQAAYQAMLERKAKNAERFAIAASPDLTGGYKRRFTVTVVDGRVLLGNTDIAAHLIEFGSINNVPHAPLRRGVRAAGLRLIET